MSASRAAQNCGFCKVGKGIYCCPKCNRKYCSSYCYKCREHEVCSEAFYRQWVEQSLQEKSSDRSDREQMLHILKKFSDDPPGDEVDIEDRFAGLDINEADESVIWQNLNEEEKAAFETLVEDGKDLEAIVSVKQPWWTITTLKLVSDIDSDDQNLEDDIVVRPPYPLNVKKLLELTSAKPSECIQYNLVNLLYSYAFLTRFYNCDLGDFVEDVVDALFILTPVLSEGKNYFSLEESLQDSIRLINTSEFDIPLSFVKSIVNDVNNIMLGPSNAKSSIFVICALHDIKLLFLEFLCKKKDVDKNLKKRVLLSVKKIEYFMSWSLEFESTLSDIASDLVLIMLPDMVADCNNYEEKCSPKVEEKPFIEEIE